MADTWQLRARCKTVDHAVFFAGNVTAEAKAVCRLCPVRQACLDYAMADPDLRGVWGGKTEAERDRIRTGAGRADRRRYGRPDAPSIAEIMGLAGDLLDVAPSAFLAAKGPRSLVAARRVAMVAAREATGASLAVVALAFGRSDLHAVSDAERIVRADPELVAQVRLVVEAAGSLRKLAS